MKKIMYMLLAVLLVTMLCALAQAENSIISGISALDAYEEMLSFFELEEYGVAREVLEKYGLAEKNIKDARLYASYLEAMACMDKGEYGLAARLYEGLMGGETPFRDSTLRYHYCTGRHAQEMGDFDQAISSYTQSAVYGDSAQRIRECMELLAKPARMLSFDEPKAESTALQLSWSDTAPDGSAYIIRYAPEHVAEPQMTTTDAPLATLEGLLPGTAYTITLEVEDQPESSLTIMAETLPAANYQSAGFTIRSTRLVGVKSSYLNFYSLEGLLNEKQTVLTYFDDNCLALEDMELVLQQMKYCYIFTYQQDEAVTAPVDVLWVLRTEDAGTYAYEQPDLEGLQASGRLFLDLELLLAPIYQAKGEWPQGTMTLELYFDCAIAARGAIILQQK